MGFSRQEYWSGDLSDPGIKFRSPSLQAGSSPFEPQGEVIKSLSISSSCHILLLVEYTLLMNPQWVLSFLGGLVVENLPVNAGCVGSIPWWGRTPWRRKWPPTSVFLLEKSHGLRRLAGSIQSRGHIKVGHNLVAKQQQTASNIYRRNGSYNKQKKRIY